MGDVGLPRRLKHAGCRCRGFNVSIADRSRPRLGPTTAPQPDAEVSRHRDVHDWFEERGSRAGWRASPALYLPLERSMTSARMIVHVAPEPCSSCHGWRPSRRRSIRRSCSNRPRPLEAADPVGLLFLRIYLAVAAFLVGAALLLSTAGIYAILSFTVSQRTREMGIRIALGASPGRVIRDVCSRAARQLGAGAAAGLTIGLLASDGPFRLSEGVLAHGPGVLLGIVVVMAGLALTGCARPLRRALRIQPTEALRGDG
jgi:hypothetical protein